MKCTVSREVFGNALKNATKTIARNPTLMILECVKLEASGDKLTITGSDADTTIVVPVSAEVLEDGVCCIKATTIRDLVLNYSGDDVHLNLGKYKLNINCGKNKSGLNLQEASDYPIFDSTGEMSFSATIDGEEFARLVSATSISIAADDSRPILQCIHIGANRERSIVRSADGFRLSIFEADINGNGECLVPARAFSLATQILSLDGKEIDICSDGNSCTISDGMTKIVSSLIHGVFPDTSSIVPDEYGIKAKVDSVALKRACRVANVFSREASDIVVVSITNGKVVLKSRAETGDTANEIECSAHDGDEIAFGVNGKYLAQYLSTITGEIMICANKPTSPIGLFSEDVPEFLHIVMPMHINEGVT